MRKIVFSACIASLLLVSACSSSFVTKNYEYRSGIVKYPNNGTKSFIKEKREEALQKIRDFCQSDYTIKLEEEVDNFNNNITFICN